MCRLLAAWFSREGMSLLDEVVDAFVEGSRRDPYLEKATGGRSSAHDDGWGIAAVGYGDTPSVIYHRMLEPIFSESSIRALEFIKKRLKRYREVYLLIHSRKSSRNEPYGYDYTHPFIRLMENGVLWFAHNGGARKEELARVLGVYPWVRVDSELLGYYIMGRIDECIENNSIDECVSKAYLEGLKFIPEGSGYNTGLLALISENASLYVSHKVPGSPLPELLEYYEIVAYTSPSIVLAGSITLRDYLPSVFSTGFERTILEPGVYRIEQGGVKLITRL